MFQVALRDALARWLPQASAALLWAMAAAAAVVWGLHLPRHEQHLTVDVAAAPVAAQDTGAVSRALGHALAPATAPDVARRFALIGVIAADSGQGSALIAFDGLPPRAFVPGQMVVDGWRLQSVSRKRAILSSGRDSMLEIELPATDVRSGRD